MPVKRVDDCNVYQIKCLFYSLVIPSRSTSLVYIQSKNGREVEEQLAEEIRSGIEDTLSSLFECEPDFILHTRFVLPVDEKDRPSLYSILNFKKRNLSAKTSTILSNSIVVEVTTLQLAIVSNQPTIVRQILQYLVGLWGNTASKASIRAVLTAKTNVTYSAECGANVDSSDICSIPGSNSFHLAVKHSPACLHSLLEFMRQRDFMTMKDVRLLLAEKDIHSGNTPLHIAASILDASPLRYELYIYS